MIMLFFKLFMAPTWTIHIFQIILNIIKNTPNLFVIICIWSTTTHAHTHTLLQNSSSEYCHAVSFKTYYQFEIIFRTQIRHQLPHVAYICIYNYQITNNNNCEKRWQIEQKENIMKYDNKGLSYFMIFHLCICIFQFV